MGDSIYSRVNRCFPAAFLLLLALCLNACSPALSTDVIRSDLAGGNFSSLEYKMAKVDEERNELVTALNLARIHQLQGNWKESIRAYEKARIIIEDYEQRAIVNMRGILSSIGNVTLARSSGGYFGAGYERSLLHTLNSINYLMLGDFSGAAVEMRRMELRQEMWLEEREYRLRANLENEAARKASMQGSQDYDAEHLPPGYTMGSILNDPSMQALISGYQEPFSYSLSSVICRIAGDREYAAVSLRRACMLNRMANEMFCTAWGKDQNPATISEASSKSLGWEPRVPQLPRTSAASSTQELTIVVLGGLAPAKKMEQIRIPNSVTGYVLVDLPSYTPVVPAKLPRIEMPGEDFKLYSLLRTDILAYRELKDELNYEIGAAISRAVSRAVISASGQAIASSKDEKNTVAPLVGLLLTVGMDAYATAGADSIRNWETLPANGYMSMLNVPKGAEITVSFANKTQKIAMPDNSRGMIMVISQVENTNVRVDYVAY